MHSQFRTYQLAVTFAREAAKLSCAPHLKSQLLRASTSIALNLSEGSVRKSDADRRRFYTMAFGSLRESQTILDLAGNAPGELVKLADSLAAHLYRLTRPKNETPPFQKEVDGS